MNAPIILFVFARPDHTRQTLEALAANRLADQSDLIVYADAARDETEIERVNAVRSVVSSITGFKSVTVIERESNFGLAQNIIEGVTEVCRDYDRVIVIEDDIVTSPYFLTFINQALDKYANEPRVWHISGWNYPIAPDGLGDAFFWRVMNCWGWATWADRWQYFEKNAARLTEAWSSDDIRRFDLDGAISFWEQVKSNLSGRSNTWAIFWYATIFENNGLCLNPSRSLVSNIGHDGSGKNCVASDVFNNAMTPINSLQLPDKFTESKLAVKYIGAFIKYNLHSGYSNRILRKLNKIFRNQPLNHEKN